jgi:hypothetical protein
MFKLTCLHLSIGPPYMGMTLRDREKFDLGRKRESEKLRGL